MSKRFREAPDMAAFIARIARAMVRRAAEGDLEALSALRDMRESIDQAMTDATNALKAEGYSYSQIGFELGITKQSVHKMANRQPAADAKRAISA